MVCSSDRRQCKGKFRHAVFACRPNLAAVRADDRLRDVKSKPPTLAVGRARLVRLVEAVKQQRQLLGWDRLAGVADAQARLLSVLLQNQPQISAKGAKIDGVIEQVIQDLRDRIPVGICSDWLLWQVED